MPEEKQDSADTAVLELPEKSKFTNGDKIKLHQRLAHPPTRNKPGTENIIPPSADVLERMFEDEADPKDIPSAENLEPQGIVLSREKQIKEGYILAPEEVKSEGRKLFKEMAKLTGTWEGHMMNQIVTVDKNGDSPYSKQGNMIHRLVTKVRTRFSRKENKDDMATEAIRLFKQTQKENPQPPAKRLFTKTKDVNYPRFAKEGGGKGDMVIEGYGKSEETIESYVVQLNRIKGNTDRPEKIKISPNGIEYLKKNDKSGEYEAHENFPEHFLFELNETIQQLKNPQHDSKMHTRHTVQG